MKFVFTFKSPNSRRFGISLQHIQSLLRLSLPNVANEGLDFPMITEKRRASLQSQISETSCLVIAHPGREVFFYPLMS